MDYGNNKITPHAVKVLGVFRTDVEVGHYTEGDAKEEQTRELISALKTSHISATIRHMEQFRSYC